MVKFATSVVVAGILASSAFASQDFGAEEVYERELSTHEDLFGRAAVKVLNDLFSREEVADLLERDVAEDEVFELSRRDVDDLFEREVEIAEAIEGLVARQAGSEGALPDGEGEPTPTSTAATATATGGAVHSASAPAPPPPAGPNIFSSFISGLATWWEGVIHPKPANATTNSTTPATPSGTASTPLPTAAATDNDAPTEGGDSSASTPEERGWDDLYEEPIERSLDYEEEFEDLTSRFYEEEEFEAREPLSDDEWDEDLLRRAYDVLSYGEDLD